MTILTLEIILIANAIIIPTAYILKKRWKNRKDSKN